jgi:hypothetical protein
VIGGGLVRHLPYPDDWEETFVACLRPGCPECWMACEHPERAPDGHCWFHFKCAPCVIAAEAGVRMGLLNPNLPKAMTGEIPTDLKVLARSTEQRRGN